MQMPYFHAAADVTDQAQAQQQLVQVCKHLHIMHAVCLGRAAVCRCCTLFGLRILQDAMLQQ